jgi:hypothetical protein
MQKILLHNLWVFCFSFQDVRNYRAADIQHIFANVAKGILMHRSSYRVQYPTCKIC